VDEGAGAVGFAKVHVARGGGAEVVVTTFAEDETLSSA
jgi:hypothetical protein